MTPPYTTGLLVSLDAALGLFKDTTKTQAATAAGDLIATWADQSGNVNDVQQATSGNRPNWQPNVINGLPVIRFAAGAAHYFVAPNTLAASSQSETIFVVYKSNNRNVQSVLTAQGLNFQFYQNNAGWFDLYDGAAHQTGYGSITAARDFQLMTLVANGTTGTVRQNGLFSTTLSGTLANNSLTLLSVGAYTNGTLYLNGDIAEILIYNAPLTGSNLSNVENYLLAKYGIPTPAATANPFVLFEGDSLTQGVNTTLNTQEYPDLVATALQSSFAQNYRNFAVAGSGFPDLTNRASIIDSYLQPGRGPGKNILVVWAGTNDINLGGLTSSAALTRMQTYCQARQLAGWKVVVLTMLPVTSSTTTETSRIAFNTSVRSNWQNFANALADVGGDANIGAPGANTNTTYYNADLIHLTPLGYTIVAGYVQTALSTLFNGRLFAVAVRFVNNTTGQQTALVPIGIVSVP